jgi:hypothetical protein
MPTTSAGRRRRSWTTVAGRAFAVAALLMAAATPHAQQSPVSAVTLSADDTNALLARVKRGLISDREREAQYTYLEKRRDVKVSKLGRVSLGDVRTFEVYPSVEPGRTYKRLVAINDTPLPAAELAKRDADHRARLEADARRLASETPAQTQAREARTQARLARQRREVDETFDSYHYVVEGRELLAGHARPLLRLRMTPRRAYRPTSKNDFVKYARKFADTRGSTRPTGRSCASASRPSNPSPSGSASWGACTRAAWPRSNAARSTTTSGCRGGHVST